MKLEDCHSEQYFVQRCHSEQCHPELVEGQLENKMKRGIFWKGRETFEVESLKKIRHCEGFSPKAISY